MNLPEEVKSLEESISLWRWWFHRRALGKEAEA